MTIKVYKKRTHWYYTYHCIEYDLGALEYLNFFEMLFNSKILYFGLMNTWRHGFVGSLYIIGNTHYLNPYPLKNFIKFKKHEICPVIIIPIKINTTIYLTFKSCVK